MKRIFGLLALAVLTTNPFFTVGHSSASFLQIYNYVIAD